MTTKQEIIEMLKEEYPSLKVGSDDTGYVELSLKEYEATLNQWADARIDKEQRKADQEALRATKMAAYQKLGLTEIEIAALLPSSAVVPII